MVQTIAALGAGTITPDHMGKVYSGTKLDAVPAPLSTTSRPIAPSLLPKNPVHTSLEGEQTLTTSRVSVRNLIANGDNLGSLTSTYQRTSEAPGLGANPFVYTTSTSTFKAYSDISSAVPDPASANGQTYVVKPQDTLRNLARSFYGDANLL